MDVHCSLELKKKKFIPYPVVCVDVMVMYGIILL